MPTTARTSPPAQCHSGGYPAVFLRVHVALLALASLPQPHALVLAAVALFHASMSAWRTRSQLSPTLCGLIDTGYALILGVGAIYLSLGGYAS